MKDAAALLTISVSLPLTIEIHDCKVKVLEAHRYSLANRQRYIVSCQAECKGRKTPVFFIDVASNEELIWKLKVELAKFKLSLIE